jgi:hypothetical protein
MCSKLCKTYREVEIQHKKKNHRDSHGKESKIFFDQIMFNLLFIVNYLFGHWFTIKLIFHTLNKSTGMYSF